MVLQSLEGLPFSTKSSLSSPSSSTSYTSYVCRDVVLFFDDAVLFSFFFLKSHTAKSL